MIKYQHGKAFVYSQKNILMRTTLEDIPVFTAEFCIMTSSIATKTKK